MPPIYQVLFPLLYDLLTEVPTVNITGNVLEESRMRTATIMSKVFLHHLTPLITLTSFSELWLDILDYIEKFMRVGSDMLHEAMLESLKNMLLVMHSVSLNYGNIFNQQTIKRNPILFKINLKLRFNLIGMVHFYVFFFLIQTFCVTN